MDKKKELVSIGLVLAAIVAVFYVLHLPCLIVFFTGCSCPGCGMSRALFHALCFDFSEAFYYHPIWPLVPLFAVSFSWAYLKGNNKVKNITVAVFVSALIVTYCIRLVIGPEEIVALNFEKSIIYRAYIFVLKIFKKM